MMRGGILRRLALAETLLQTSDQPPSEGLAGLLEHARRHGWTAATDSDVDSERPLTGMARVLWEARHPGEPAP